MIHGTATINWHEGMFMQPHHFQASDLSLALRNAEQVAATPCMWGVSRMSIDKSALEGFRFKLHSGTLRFADGTWVDIPGNAAVAAKSFEDKMPAAGSSLPVWAGIRRPDENLPSVHPPGQDDTGTVRPFIVREVGFKDENIGDNEQLLQIKLRNVRLFLENPPGDEYEALKIAEIIRSPHTDLPILDSEYIPPLVNIGASPGFKEKIKNLVIHLNNQASYMRREVAEKKGLLSSDPAKILTTLMKVQVAASFGQVLTQLEAMDETHPLQLYLELTRLAGALAPISTEVPLDIPLYSHTNLTGAFGRLLSIIWNMLEGGVVPEYVERSFELKKSLRTCRLDREWLENEYAVYLCIDSDLPENQIDTILSDLRVKIGPVSRIEELLAERRRGLICSRIRRVPMGLQDRTGLNYFTMDLSRKSEFWNDFQRDLMLEIRGIPSNVLPAMKLYVHVNKES